jgi:hypothetical protein
MDESDHYNLEDSTMGYSPSELRRRDFTCGPGQPCSNGACCGSSGFCGYGRHILCSRYVATIRTLTFVLDRPDLLRYRMSIQLRRHGRMWTVC